MKRLLVALVLAGTCLLALPAVAKEMYPGLNKCYSIKNMDLQRFCIARKMKASEKCSPIRNDDIRAYCLAVTTKAKTRCWSIKNKPLQNQCVGEFR